MDDKQVGLVSVALGVDVVWPPSDATVAVLHTLRDRLVRELEDRLNAYNEAPGDRAQIEALDAAIRLLSRPQRNPTFVGEWHAKAVALGYDGVADLLECVARGEPPIHVAEVMAAASRRS